MKNLKGIQFISRKITGAYMDKIKIAWLSKANAPSGLWVWLEVGLHEPFKNWLFV